MMSSLYKQRRVDRDHSMTSLYNDIIEKRPITSGKPLDFHRNSAIKTYQQNLDDRLSKPKRRNDFILSPQPGQVKGQKL